MHVFRRKLYLRNGLHFSLLLKYGAVCFIYAAL